MGRIEVARTARFFQLGRPGAGVGQVWMVCHGYRQSAGRFARRFEAARDEGAVVVAPEALSRFYVDPAPGAHGPASRVGASWMTRVDREAEIRDYVRYLDALARRTLEYERDASTAAGSRPRLVALGFSQGGHAAARWAALGSAAVDELVLWGSYLPPDPEIAARLAGVRVTTVFGDRDPVFDAPLRRDQEARLASAGVAQAWRTFSGVHEVDASVVRDLARRFAPGRAG